MLELMALAVTWLINWSGLLLYLSLIDESTDSTNYSYFVSTCILASITAYLIGATEFLYQDCCHKTRRCLFVCVSTRIKSIKAILSGDPAFAVTVVSATSANDSRPEDKKCRNTDSVVKIRPDSKPDAIMSRPDRKRDDNSPASRRRRKSMRQSKRNKFESQVRSSFQARKRASHIKKAHSIEKNSLAHDRLFRERQKEEKEKAHLKVLERVEARKRLRESKKLLQVGAFETFEEKALVKIIEKMKCSTFKKGQAIVKQGDIADRFYIISSGACSVRRHEFTNITHSKEIAKLEEWAHFGEAACYQAAKDWQHQSASHLIKRGNAISDGEDITMSSDKDEDEEEKYRVALRNATVIASSDSVTVLSLSNSSLQELFCLNAIDADKMLQNVQRMDADRQSRTRRHEITQNAWKQWRPAPKPPDGLPPVLK